MIQTAVDRTTKSKELKKSFVFGEAFICFFIISLFFFQNNYNEMI